jgi:hypothetical protein
VKPQVITRTSSFGTVQADYTNVCHYSVLVWADTLTDISAEAWRVPRGDSVHLSITGRLPCGTEVLIYDVVPVTDLRLSADLAPGAKSTLPLATLRSLATPGLVTEKGTL